MARIRGDKNAFGWPGLAPRWTHGDKDGIGTAYSAASRIWFTVWNGIVTGVYYPTVDMPQMRDVQLLFTDGQSFFHQETQYLETCIQRMPSCLGYSVEGADPEGRYAYVKELIADQTMRGPLWIELAKKAPDTFWLTHESFRRRSPRWRLNARDHTPKIQSLGECPAWRLQFVSSRTVG